MATNKEESLRQLRRDAEAMARSLGLSVDEAEAILRQQGPVDEYLSDADAHRMLTAISARIDQAEACSAVSFGQQAGPVEQLKEVGAFIVKCLADLLSPSCEGAALGSTDAAVDLVKEIPIREAMRAEVPWLSGRALEVYRAGQAKTGTRYGVRVVPGVAAADAPRQLRVTLRAADGKSATTVLTARRTARVFGDAFVADWSALSLELCAEDEHGQRIQAALPDQNA